MMINQNEELPTTRVEAAGVVRQARRARDLNFAQSTGIARNRVDELNFDRFDSSPHLSRNMKSKLFLLSCIIAAVAATSFAQTYGCPATDNLCRLGRAMRMMQDDPSDPEHVYNIGLIYQQMGDHPRAINAFTMYVAMPGLKAEYAADGYNNRGVSQRAAKKPDLAIVDYSKAIELDPKNPRFYVNRGNAKVDLKQGGEALADYGRAIAINPKHAPAFAARGHYYASIEKTDDALADLAKAIELQPSDSESYYTRAFVYRSRKEFAKAIPDLDKYIALVPGNPQYLADGYLNRGIAYGETGKLEQAIADITKALEASPKYIAAYRARAITYRLMKKNDLADADEKKAEQLAAEINR